MRRRAVFFLLLVSICGGVIVVAQVKSSAFYSSYDPRELVKNGKYKGIDFNHGETGDEIVAELPDGGSEKTKSASYGCRIQKTGDDAFDIDAFLKWLAAETISQIENGKGTVVRQSHKVGRRFYIEYAQDGFAARVEVDAYLIEKDQMSLDVEIIESTRN
ncbi:MAG: hypothetical protein ACRD8U_18380 [Pyrinomonadaceae bacterium]